MPVITLPDGSENHYDAPVSVMDVAADIGPGLAKAALAGEVNGQLVDAAHEIASDANLRIITARNPEGLEIIRHSTAHLLAQAVQRLFPDAQVTIGPVIENGFYYDFAHEPGFNPEDLEAIEAEMQKIVDEGLVQGQGLAPGVGADGDAVGNGGRLQVVEAGAGFKVQMRMLRVCDQQAAPFQHPHDAPAEGVEQLGQFRVGGSPGSVKGWPPAAERVGSIEEPCAGEH
jgi:hypothetical protein